MDRRRSEPEVDKTLVGAALATVFELLPILSAVFGGIAAGLAGTLFFRDWVAGLACLIIGGVAGFCLGLVLQVVFGVASIWRETIREAVWRRNNVALLCGAAAVSYVMLRFLLDPRPIDFGPLGPGMLVSFTFGAGFGGGVQAIWRKIRRATGGP